MTNNYFDRVADQQQEEYLPNWHGSKKRPALIENEEPLFLMTKGEPRSESNRAYQIKRHDALATPAQDKDKQEDSLINWASHYHTPDSWEKLQEKAFPEAENSVIYMTQKARNNMLTSFKNYLESNEDTVMVNPTSVIDTFSNKEATAQHLRNYDLPTIPSTEASNLLYEGQEYLEDQIGYADEGIILKPKEGRGGKGIKEFESFNDLEQFLDNRKFTKEMRGQSSETEQYLDDYLIQTKIPHESDLRIITAGDHIGNAARRISADGELATNLSGVSSKINGEHLGVHGTAINALKEGRLQPIDVKKSQRTDNEIQEILNRDNLIGNGVQELTEETIYSFEPKDFNYDSSLSQPPLFIGMDVIETDLEDLEHLPSEYREDVERFADKDQAYILTELNHQPGTTVDALARLTGNPEQISTIHQYNLMRDLADLETLDVESIVENEDSKTWNRVDSYYPNIEGDMDEFVKKVKKT